MPGHGWSAPDRVTLDIFQSPHRRLNLLTNEWVLVSPHRTSRPWQGQVERPDKPQQLDYDPSCYLCPGNARAGGTRNPHYKSTFVFDNDFPALLPGQPTRLPTEDFFRAEAASGICRVGCFSPRHSQTMPLMAVPEIEDVIKLWTHQFLDLGSRPEIQHVQIFENRGEMMGASNAHPHLRIGAAAFLPTEAQKELAGFEAFKERAGECVLCSYAKAETPEGERTVYEN